MVARNTDADVRHDHRSGDVLRRFLEWWQRLLTSVLHHSKTAVDIALRRAGKAASSLRGPLAARSRVLAWAGGLAVVIGALGTIAVSAPGQSRTIAVSAAVMMTVWAAVRWALLDVAARFQEVSGRSEVRSAWALGSLVWMLGVTPELRALAWLISAVVTWVVLERLGAPRRQALVCVGIAWGAQAFVVVGSWLAKNALIAVLALQG